MIIFIHGLCIGLGIGVIIGAASLAWINEQKSLSEKRKAQIIAEYEAEQRKKAYQRGYYSHRKGR